MTSRRTATTTASKAIAVLMIWAFALSPSASMATVQGDGHPGSSNSSALNRRASAPRIHGVFSGRTTKVLLVGYPLSLQRLRDEPQCRALFEPFGTSGEEMVARSLFTIPTSDELDLFCVGGTAAITMVGSRVTKLCPCFGDLDRRAAATIVIHEALHQAGMHESPATAGAPSSEQINRMVRDACGL
jgi:hypothetical protein